MSEAIDWNAAARVGVGLIRPGPSLSEPDRAAAVERLRRAAGRAPELEAAASRLPNAEAAATGVTLVVDRAGIVRANAAAMAAVFDGLDGQTGRPGVAGKTVGSMAGVVFAVVGSAVLGQYEPFTDRLLLSAPTVEAVRAGIGADPDDFALWVVLHEQTHRHQFAAAPWLRDYLRDLIRRAAQLGFGDSSGNDKPSRSQRKASRVPGMGLAGLLGATGAKSIIDEVTAVMSLLEGYADMLMDVAGASVIPTLPSIRAAFDERRQHPQHDLGALLRRLLGLTAKIDQYVVGKAFCEAVRREVGLDGLNEAFREREALPTVAELRDPAAWVARRFRPGAAPGVPGGA